MKFIVGFNRKNEQNIDYNLKFILSAILFLLILVVPTNYMLIKFILITLLGIRLIFCSVNKKLTTINIRVWLILYLIVFKGVFWLFYGVMNGNSVENIKTLFPFYCIWPLFYLLLFLYVDTWQKFSSFCNLILYAHAFIVVYNLYSLCSVYIGVEPISIFQSDQTFMLEEEIIGISNPSLQQLVFTTPFLFSILISGKIQGTKRNIFYVIFSLTIFVMLLSGRGVMILVLLLLPFIPIGIIFFSKVYRFSHFKNMYWGVILIFFLCLGYTYSSGLQNLIMKSLIDNFDSSIDYTRFSQRTMLIKMWKEKPLLGHGLAASYYNRDRGYHTAVESMYHADLAKTGIIGFGLFLFYLFLIYYYTIKEFQRTNNVYIYACIIGLSFYLLASATNPFLASFDRLYPIYVCLCIINIGSKNKYLISE